MTDGICDGSFVRPILDTGLRTSTNPAVVARRWERRTRTLVARSVFAVSPGAPRRLDTRHLLLAAICGEELRLQPYVDRPRHDHCGSKRFRTRLFASARTSARQPRTNSPAPGESPTHRTPQHSASGSGRSRRIGALRIARADERAPLHPHEQSRRAHRPVHPAQLVRDAALRNGARRVVGGPGVLVGRSPLVAQLLPEACQCRRAPRLGVRRSRRPGARASLLHVSARSREALRLTLAGPCRSEKGQTDVRAMARGRARTQPSDAATCGRPERRGVDTKHRDEGGVRRLDRAIRRIARSPEGGYARRTWISPTNASTSPSARSWRSSCSRTRNDGTRSSTPIKPISSSSSTQHTSCFLASSASSAPPSKALSSLFSWTRSRLNRRRITVSRVKQYGLYKPLTRARNRWSRTQETNEALLESNR